MNFPLQLVAPRSLASPGADLPPEITRAPEMRIGIALAALFGTGLIAAGFFIPLDAAVVAPGVVKVSGERRSVQSEISGTVSGIAVRDGSQVRAGQVVVRFNEAQAKSLERALAGRVISLQAEIARLEAQQSGSRRVEAGPELSAYSGADAELARRALQVEQANLATDAHARATRDAVLRERVSQMAEQRRESASRQTAYEKQRDLMSEEREAVETLAKKGYASRMRLLQARRDEAGLEGSAEAMAAERERLRVGEGEARLQIAQARADDASDTAQRIRDARAELAGLIPQWKAAREQLMHSVIRSPVTGEVVDNRISAPGAVVREGEPLFDVVPADRGLTIEARVAPDDGNSIRPGQEVRLRIPTPQGRAAPVIHGQVSSIAADTVVDDRTGRSYYRMDVRIPSEAIAEVKQASGNQDAVFRPGTPATVTVSVRSRSSLGYWLEPLFQSIGSSLHER
ncbi:HlyD family secretion protein [Stakelama sp. CBK3Z-3]|uniref:Membrane fusion protein (MFP) family protein n=1 Tax=Stakelama flava TaxID=2860338 RepID=A0ABS6XIA0_9SPHN|nr:HlyD family type I secretion periplasmic adaptor subunit [Stakelama flava]MBW4329907.1 HlyD family secretion protein [Stakelama flava]